MEVLEEEEEDTPAHSPVVEVGATEGLEDPAGAPVPPPVLEVTAREVQVDQVDQGDQRDQAAAVEEGMEARDGRGR